MKICFSQKFNPFISIIATAVVFVFFITTAAWSHPATSSFLAVVRGAEHPLPQLKRSEAAAPVEIKALMVDFDGTFYHQSRELRDKMKAAAWQAHVDNVDIKTSYHRYISGIV